jgi:hypothetical protein
MRYWISNFASVFVRTQVTDGLVLLLLKMPFHGASSLTGNSNPVLSVFKSVANPETFRKIESLKHQNKMESYKCC